MIPERGHIVMIQVPLSVTQRANQAEMEDSAIPVQTTAAGGGVASMQALMHDQPEPTCDRVDHNRAESPPPIPRDIETG
jgi:hypothetical protein